MPITTGQNTVPTTDATPTVLYSEPTATRRGFRFFITARQTGAVADDFKRFEVTAQLHQDDEAAWSQRHNIVHSDGTAGASAWTVSCDVSGGNFRLLVTGAAATTITWVARREVMDA